MDNQDNPLDIYVGVFDFDWAVKLIDPEALVAFEAGDGFERLQMIGRLLKARHLAATIIFEERDRCAKIAFLQEKQGSTARQIEQAILKGDVHDRND